MRFAILCRVSTQGQATDGVSLDNQKQVLSRCIQMLSGTLVKEYIGAEHATSGYERPILDDAIDDAKRGLFDGLMVYDLSRLARDPIALAVIRADLKKYKVKLYIQAQEYDLNNEETNFIMDIMTVINSRNVRIQNRKSIESKITLAKQGWQMVGSGPWGRVLAHNDRSKPAEWILDNDAFNLAQRIYDLYVNQRFYVDKIGRIVGKSGGMIYKILNDKSRLIQTFETPDGPIEIITPVPPFFSKEQQAQIKARLKANKKLSKRLFDYLLAGFVKCEYCQLTYQGVYANNGKNPYYRHSHHKRTDRCIKFIPKSILDDIVINHISEIVQNNDTLTQAITKSNSTSITRKNQLETELSLLEQEQATQSKLKDKIVNFIIDGVFTSDDGSKRLSAVKQALETLHLEITSKRLEFESLSANTDIPTEILERITFTINSLKQKHGNTISLWGFGVQRILVEWFFGISNENGVFIGERGTYTIKSNLGTLGFGIVGEDCDFGITGLANSLSPDTIQHFASLFNNIEINPISRSSKWRAFS